MSHYKGEGGNYLPQQAWQGNILKGEGDPTSTAVITSYFYQVVSCLWTLVHPKKNRFCLA